MCGGAHAHLRAFTPPAVLDAIARERITFITLVPTMITALVNHPAIGEHDLSSLRRLIYGASPMPPATLRAALGALPCQFYQGYGLTEASPGLAFLLPEDHRDDGSTDAARRLRSAGRAALGVHLRVVDEADREVLPGAVGEVIARGANITRGYWRRPEETAEALRGGWLHTGDLATLDEAGYLTIVDRKRNLIISGGENVYSVEVERALADHPAVLECAVIGVPDPSWGEAVRAIVVLKPGATAGAATLLAHCRERIAGFKVPKAVKFRDALPKSGAGKVLKRELREPYWAGETKGVH